MKQSTTLLALLLGLLLLFSGCSREIPPEPEEKPAEAAPAEVPEEQTCREIWTSTFTPLETDGIIGGAGPWALAHTSEAKERIHLLTGERIPMEEETVSLAENGGIYGLRCHADTQTLELAAPDGSLTAIGVTPQNSHGLLLFGNAWLIPSGEQWYLLDGDILYDLSGKNPVEVEPKLRFAAAAAVEGSLYAVANPREQLDWQDHLYEMDGETVTELEMPELAGTVRRLCAWQDGLLAVTDAMLYFLHDGQAEPILNLVERGISLNQLAGLSVLEEGIVLLVEDGWFLVRRETVPADAAEPVVLEAACLQDYRGITAGLLAAFNRQSSGVVVRPVLYDSVEKLHLALMTGQLPDLIFPDGNAELLALCREKNLLAPAPLPDSVTDEDYFLHILDLEDRYFFPLCYTLHTYSMESQLLGERTRLDTLEELDAVLAAAGTEVYERVYREQIFWSLFEENLGPWLAEEGAFDGPEFGEFLQWCSRFVPDGGTINFDVWFPLQENMIGQDLQVETMEGQTVIPAPFSPWNGPGVRGISYAAVTTAGAEKPETKELLAYLLGDEAQAYGASFGYNPLKRSAVGTKVTHEWMMAGPEAQAQRIALIEQADHLMIGSTPLKQIILEEAAAYFAGARSLEDTQRLIQDRISLYLMEQKTS